MRIGPIGETVLERAAILLRLGPRPLLETHATLLLAQTMMVATKVGIFEALAPGPLRAAEIASRCGADVRATEKLLGVLAASGYLRVGPGGTYALTGDARTWLLKDGTLSLRDNILFRFVEWEWIARLETFAKTGEPLDIHSAMPPKAWGLYQRGMRSLAGTFAREVARRTPVPRAARAMLDVGGSHGYLSVTLCRRHPALRAEIVDLPEAVAESAEILAREGLGDRVTVRAADALTADLGTRAFDLVLVSNVLHHLETVPAKDLMRRAGAALRPRGVLVVQEMFAAPPGKRASQTAALADLYFALTSRSGTLPAGQIASWQREAGLRPRRPIRFVTFPGLGQQSAVKAG